MSVVPRPFRKYVLIDVTKVGKGEIMRVSWEKDFLLALGTFFFPVFKLDLFVDVRHERANVFNMLVRYTCGR